MSLKTWMREFYPTPAEKATKSDLVATRHSLRKWRGLTKANLKRHGLTVSEDGIHDDGDDWLEINSHSCALCRRYATNTTYWLDPDCPECPLYATLGRQCDGWGSEFGAWLDDSDPSRMIRALTKTLKRLEGKGA